jgi:hypothetical protein
MNFRGDVVIRAYLPLNLSRQIGRGRLGYTAQADQDENKKQTSN